MGPLGAMGGITPEERRRRLAMQMGGPGMGAPGMNPAVLAAQQQMMGAMNQAGPPPAAFAMPGAAPGAPMPAGLAAGLGAAPPVNPANMAPAAAMMAANMPGPPVAAPAPGPPPALRDAIMANYQNQMKAPMQQANVPLNKLGMGAMGLAGLGMGGAATGSPVGAGVGAGVGMLGEYLKQRKGRKNLGTGQFAQGGLVKEPVRMAMGGAAKVRKDFPKMPGMPKKNSFGNPLDGTPTAGKARGMGAALRGHNYKGSV